MEKLTITPVQGGYNLNLGGKPINKRPLTKKEALFGKGDLITGKKTLKDVFSEPKPQPKTKPKTAKKAAKSTKKAEK